MLRVTLFGSRNTASSGKTFEPKRGIPSLAGKVILITGAAGDLGRQTAIELARYGRPARIYIADLPSAYGDDDDDVSTPRTTFRFLELDLTSFDSVRACAAEFVAKEDRLDVLVLNAGVIRVPPLLTTEGYELHFGLNYLGHALLARLLVPTLQQTAQQGGGGGGGEKKKKKEDVRVVVISSEGHAVAPKEGIAYSKLKTPCAEMPYTQRYGQSKLALIGLTRELARRYPDIKAAAVHPGRILTGMADSLRKESLLARATAPIAPFFCVPVSEGIRNHLWAATSPDVVSGTYYEPVGVPAKTSHAARDDDMPTKLWEWTSKELAYLDELNSKQTIRTRIVNSRTS
ncbi:NAD(P)-binding protein [Xylariaceae sp. FL0594]|nr:NAD(P)-binding protein [Xylariaceae sp. FL0594]